MLQIFGGADGDRPHPFRTLPEVIDVPVHLLPQAAVPGEALIEILLRRAGVYIVPFREMHRPEAADLYVRVFRKMQRQQVAPPVSRFFFNDRERRGEETDALRTGQVVRPPQGRRFPFDVRRGGQEGLREFRIGVVIRQEPFRPVPLDEDEEPRLFSPFPDLAEVEASARGPSRRRETWRLSPRRACTI